jgi:hypothetical protein
MLDIRTASRSTLSLLLFERVAAPKEQPRRAKDFK